MWLTHRNPSTYPMTSLPFEKDIATGRSDFKSAAGWILPTARVESAPSRKSGNGCVTSKTWLK